MSNKLFEALSNTTAPGSLDEYIQRYQNKDQVTQDKANNVQQAKQTKYLNLGPTIPEELESVEELDQQIAVAQEQSRIAKQEAELYAPDDSGKIISNKQVDTALGFAANTALKGYAAFVKVLGDTARAPSSFFNSVEGKNITKEDLVMYETLQRKFDSGEPLTPEEDAFRKPGKRTRGRHRGQRSPSKYEKLTDILAREQFLNYTDKVIGNISGLVNDRDTNIALDKLNKNSVKVVEEVKGERYLEGVGTFLGGIKDLATENTDAAVELTVEALPQMYALAKNAAFNIGIISTNSYEQAIEEFKQEYGRNPNETEQATAGILVLASASLDALGAKAVLGGSKIFKILPELAADVGVKINKNLVNEAGRSALRLAEGVVEKTIKGAASVKPIRSAITEGFTEGSQAGLEQLAGKQDIAKLDPTEVLTEATVGSVVGGVIKTTTEAPKAVAKITGVAKDKAEGIKAVGKKAKGVLTKDAAVQVQEAVESGSPDEVIEVVTNISLKDSPQEERVANLKAMNRAIATLQAKAERLDQSDEKTSELQRVEELYTQLDNMIVSHKALIEQEQEGVTTKQAVDTIIAANEPESITEEVVERTLASMQTSTKQITLAQAEEMLANKIFQETATKEQIVEVTAYRDRVKKLAEVREDIKYGTEESGFIGTETHLTNLESAISLGDQEAAQDTINKLEKFQTLQESKIKALEAQIKKQTNKQGQIVGETFLQVPGVAKPFTVSAKTPKLVKAIKKDVEDISAAKEQAQSIFFSAFDAKSTVPQQDTTPATPTSTPVSEAVVTPENAKALSQYVQKLDDKTLSESQVKQKAGVIDKLKRVAEGKEITPQAALKLGSYIKKAAATSKTNIQKAQELEAKKETAKLKDIEASTRNKAGAYRTKLAEMKLANPEAQKLRDQIIARLESDLESSVKTVLSAPREKALNEAIMKVRRLEAGKEVSEPTTETIANSVLSNGLRDTSKSKNKITGDTLLQASGKKIGGLLNVVPNLFTNLKSPRVQKKLGSLNETQLNTFKRLANFNKTFSEIITGTSTTEPLLKMLINGSPVFADDMQEDPISFLITENLDGTRKLNENLVSVLAAVSFNYIGSQGTQTLFNDSDAINKILGRDENTEVTLDELKQFMHIGTTRNSMAEDLGNEAFKLLGLKVKDTTEGTFEKRLKLSLGELAITTMLEGDILIQESIPSTVFNSIADTDAQINKNSAANFIQIKSTHVDPETGNTEKYKLFPNKANQNIIESVRSGKDLLTNLFDIEPKIVKPGLKASSVVPKKQKGTEQKISDKVHNVLIAMQNVKWKAKINVLAITDFMGKDSMLRMNGYNEDIEGTTHVSQITNVEGKNLALERELQHVYDFQEEHADKVDKYIYFNYEVYKNGRIGDTSNTISLQKNKIHRHLFGAQAWETTVDTKEDREQFKYAVALAFGFSVDSNLAADTINYFDTEIITSEVVQAGITAIHNIQDGSGTKEDRAAIEEAVKEGGEEMHSLDALIALAAYKDNEPFQTNLGNETDGKTSGIIIGTMQSMTGINDRDKLAAGGVYTDGKTTDFGQYTKDGKKDSYQRLAAGWSKSLELTAKNSPVAKGIRKLIGSFVIRDDGQDVVTDLGRKLSKNPLLITNYGAAVKRVVSEFGSTVLDTFYADIVKHRNDPDKLKEIETAVNEALGYATSDLFAIVIPTGDAVLKFELSKDQANRLRENVEGTYGKALEDTLKEQFGDFNSFRKQVNNALKVMFYAFELKYNAAIDQATKDKGRSLTSKEENDIAESLREYMPTFKGPVSKGTEDGILGMKTESVRSYTPEYRVQQKYSRGIKNTKNVTNPKLLGNSIGSVTGHTTHREYRDGGVAPMILAIHNIDSAVIQEVMKRFDALNIFDAGYYKLQEVQEGTTEYNKAFREVNENYSIIESVFEAYNNVLAKVQESPADYHALNNKVRNDSSLGGKDASINEFTSDLTLETQAVKAARDTLFTGSLDIGQAPHPKSTYTPPVDILTEAQIEDEIAKLFQSIPDEIDFDNFKSTFDRSITSANTISVFNELDKLGNVKETQAHSSHLKNILTNLVNKTLDNVGQFELRLKEESNQTYGAIAGKEIFINAAASHLVVGNSVQMSAQETYVHELVHAITRHGVDNNFNIRKELLKLFEQARKVVTWEDFMARDAQGNIIIAMNQKAEEDAAKARYDYIFNNIQQYRTQKKDPATGHTIYESTNNYLHEFVAHGLTNKQLMSKLEEIPAAPTRDIVHGSILERLTEAFNRLLDWVSGKFYGTAGLTADKALIRLTEELTGIHTKNRQALYEKLDFLQGYNEELTSGLNNYIFKPIAEFREKHLKTAQNLPARALNTIIGVPVVATHKQFSAAMKRVRRRLGFVEETFVTKLVDEVKGTTENNIKWHSMLRYSKKYIDQARRHEAEEVTSQIIESFHNEYTEEESKALNRVLLKTDMISLMNDYNIQEIQDFLLNQVKLDTAIKDIKDQLTTYGNQGNYYINQSRGLGEMMAQGVTRTKGQMLNAHNIAKMTSIKTRDPEGDLDQAEHLIELLASLYAIDFTAEHNKRLATNVMKKEYRAHPDDNGVTLTLELQRQFKENSLYQIFDGKKGLMIKGYTHEIFNPNVAVRIGTLDDELTFNKDGFIRQESPLGKDANDPNKTEHYLYVSKSHATDTYLKSIASLTERKLKGFTTSDAYIMENVPGAKLQALLDRQEIFAAESEQVENQFEDADLTRNGSYDTLIPVPNANGDTRGYRYMMSEHSKVTLMEKDDRFDIIMGKMFGSIVDKANTVEVNKNVLKLAKEDFDQGYAEDPAGFVTIGKHSTDTRYKEIYQMMPNEMKRDMQAIWGKDDIVVRRELVDLIFGYRKFALEQHKYLKHIPAFIDRTIGFMVKNPNFSRDFGEVWQTVVATAKDNIVIKSGVVLLGNVNSNNLLLFVKGVPLRDIFSQQALALRALNDFMQEVKEKNALERKVKLPTLSTIAKKNMQAKIARLKDNIKNNPVKDLVDEGIFQSISEDVNIDDHIYGSKERLLRAAKPIIDKVPGLALDSYKQAYMSHDTAAYKLLLRGTQYSDFIARFALYQHNTKVKGMPKEEALADIVETFINYDIPTGKEMQYINDIGLMMFTKFLFRIQKVIFKNLKDKPATSLAVYSLQEMFGDVSDIADSNLITSSLMGRINTPDEVIDSATYLGGLGLMDNIAPDVVP